VDVPIWAGGRGDQENKKATAQVPSRIDL